MKLIQNAKMVTCVFLITNLAQISMIMTLIIILTPKLRLLVLPYIVYRLYDDNINPMNLRLKFVSSLYYWYHEYFQTKIIKQDQSGIRSSKNSIMGIHPHGFLVHSIKSCFLNHNEYFQEKFPYIKHFFYTAHDFNFKIPIFREIILFLGYRPVTKKFITTALNDNKGSTICAIVVGGVKEIHLKDPRFINLYIKNRYGFVKIALETGSDLIPTFCFGENDIYYTNFWKSLLKFFNYNQFSKYLFHYYGFSFFGFPSRINLNVIVGNPIPVSKFANPTQEMVQELHRKYMQELRDLYNRNVNKFTQPGEVPKELVFH